MSNSKKPINLPDIRNITISGRIGTGKTTLAERLAKKLRWQVLDGGKIFRKIASEKGLHIQEANKRPDEFDLAYEERIKKMLKEEKGHIVQSHLAGFDAQGIDGVYKILVICDNVEGEDKPSIRIDRLMNRDNLTSEEARHEILERETQDLEKFRRLYADNDSKWFHWDRKYYDLIVNTYSLSPKEALDFVLENLRVE